MQNILLPGRSKLLEFQKKKECTGRLIDFFQESRPGGLIDSKQVSK